MTETDHAAVSLLFVSGIFLAIGKALDALIEGVCASIELSAPSDVVHEQKERVGNGDLLTLYYRDGTAREAIDHGYSFAARHSYRTFRWKRSGDGSYIEV